MESVSNKKITQSGDRKFEGLALVLQYIRQKRYNMKKTLATLFNVVLMRTKRLLEIFNSGRYNLFLFKWSYIHTTNDEKNHTYSNCVDVPGGMRNFVYVGGTYKIK